MFKANGIKAIEASAYSVAGIVFDPSRDSEWLTGVLSSKLVSDGELGVGSKIVKKAEYFGKRYEADFDVLEFEEGRLLRMRTAVPIEFEVIFQIFPKGETCEVSMSLNSLGKLPIAMPEFIVVRALEESISRDLKKLKSIAEKTV